jgi:CheY-like chemotaxis protein
MRYRSLVWGAAQQDDLRKASGKWCSPVKVSKVTEDPVSAHSFTGSFLMVKTSGLDSFTGIPACYHRVPWKIMEELSMLGRPSILIIDDESNLRRSLALILQKAGYFVSTAGDYWEAMLQLKDNEFAMFLVDLRLPKVNGLDLLMKLHQLCPEIPALLLTASEPPQFLEIDQQLVKLNYLIKPVDPRLLLEQIKLILADPAQERV